MKPKKQERSGCDDLFRMRLEQILDQRHVLYRLAGKIDWAAVEERFVLCIQRKAVPASRSG
jgi:transposase, IS5 family